MTVSKYMVLLFAAPMSRRIDETSTNFWVTLRMLAHVRAQQGEADTKNGTERNASKAIWFEGSVDFQQC